MRIWENFENEIVGYLDEILKDYDLEIIQYGNANSTMPDIEITLNNTKNSFFIETKMPLSQTSQFVVERENNKFKYGNNNKFKPNSFSDDILDILNNNYKMYKNVSQSSIIVSVPETIAFGWIISNMKNKNVEFIMSVDSNNKERIIPIESFKEFFNVKTIFRRKKSGSSSLPQKYYEDFETVFNQRFKDYKLIIEKSKFYVELNKDLQKSECYIDSEILVNKKYFLSKKENNLYEVKLTSSTNNLNIIFELSAKDNLDPDIFTIQMLINYIEKMEE
ncbi:MAG: hypothetical protein RRY16_03165 [Bacilli bacterium]